MKPSDRLKAIKTIKSFKRRHGIKTDADLAKLLCLNANRVRSWMRGEVIPENAAAESALQKIQAFEAPVKSQQDQKTEPKVEKIDKARLEQFTAAALIALQTSQYNINIAHYLMAKDAVKLAEATILEIDKRLK